MNSRISGLGISSQWRGGTIYGLMKVSQNVSLSTLTSPTDLQILNTKERHMRNQHPERLNNSCIMISFVPWTRIPPFLRTRSLQK